MRLVPKVQLQRQAVSWTCCCWFQWVSITLVQPFLLLWTAYSSKLKVGRSLIQGIKKVHLFWLCKRSLSSPSHVCNNKYAGGGKLLSPPWRRISLLCAISVIKSLSMVQAGIWIYVFLLLSHGLQHCLPQCLAILSPMLQIAQLFVLRSNNWDSWYVSWVSSLFWDHDEINR